MVEGGGDDLAKSPRNVCKAEILGGGIPAGRCIVRRFA